MSSFENPSLQPSVPAAPYRLPELVLAEKCMGCVSLNICTGPALQSAGSDFNRDLDRLRGTPTEDRVISAAFAVGLQTIERGFGQAQQAINDCYGGVEIVDTRPAEEAARNTFLKPVNLAPYLGLQTIPQNYHFQPRETDEELAARGFMAHRSSDGNRVTSVGVIEAEKHLDPSGYAYAYRTSTAGLDLIASLREAALVINTLPEDFSEMVQQTVARTVAEAIGTTQPQAVPHPARRR